MNGAGRNTAFAQDSLQVQQTTGIDRGHELSTGRGNTLSLRISHSGGDVGKLSRKGSTETTAFLGAGHFNQLQSFHLAQKLQRLVAQVELAQPVAGRMVGNRSAENWRRLG